MNKALLSTLTIVALVGCASMDKMENKMMGVVVKSKLTACPTKTAIGEVPACGKVWKLASGSAELKTDGTLTAQVKGLVLNDVTTGTFNGTPDGVDGVAAAVVCAGRVAAQTDVVPLSQAGDATVNTNVVVRKHCKKPVIVLLERYEGNIGGWLAATGM